MQTGDAGDRLLGLGRQAIREHKNRIIIAWYSRMEGQWLRRKHIQALGSEGDETFDPKDTFGFCGKPPGIDGTIYVHPELVSVMKNVRREFKRKVQDPWTRALEFIGDGDFATAIKLVETIPSKILKRDLKQLILMHNPATDSTTAFPHSITITEPARAQEIARGAKRQQSNSRRVSKDMLTGNTAKLANAGKDSPSLDARAVAYITENMRTTMTAMAKALGCSRQALYSLPQLAKVRPILRNAARQRGSSSMLGKIGSHMDRADNDD